MSPHSLRAWAPCGQTPVVSEPCRYTHVSVIAGISPEGKICSTVQSSSFKGADVVAFLKQALQEIGGRLLILWDGAAIHRCGEVKAYLKELALQAESELRPIELHLLPSYSPELNASEQVWKTLKCEMLRDKIFKNRTELLVEVKVAMETIAQQKQRIIKCFHHEKVGFIELKG